VQVTAPPIAYEPLTQARLLKPVTSGHSYPAGQLVQLLAPPSAKDPGLQSVTMALVVDGHIFPAGHAVHAMSATPE